MQVVAVAVGMVGKGDCQSCSHASIASKRDVPQCTGLCCNNLCIPCTSPALSDRTDPPSRLRYHPSGKAAATAAEVGGAAARLAGAAIRAAPTETLAMRAAALLGGERGATAETTVELKGTAMVALMAWVTQVAAAADAMGG